MIVADDAATAGRELAGALERVSQRVVAEQLCVLDNSIGLSVSKLVLKKFQFLATEKTDNTDRASESESVFIEPTAPLTLAAAVSSGEVINIE
jgi:hypothetical protein